MSTTILVLPESIALQIANQARVSQETGGVLLASVIDDGDQVRILARELHWVPLKEYSERRSDRLSIRSSGYVPALARAEDIDATALWLHTHPGGRPVPSGRDDVVDMQLAEVFPVRTGQDFYGSMVFSPTEDLFSFTGRIYVGDIVQSIDRAWSVGSRFRLTPAFDVPHTQRLPTIFDRQVRAFGGAIQSILGGLTVSVVGCGGTGSAVTEQLSRLGVGRLILVDPDFIEDTNVTRVYGSYLDDVGRHKADVLADHVRRISPMTNVTTIVGKATEQTTARALAVSDLVFGCTDDNAGRIILSRLSSYYLIPVIDCGVLISSEAGTLLGIDGRVTILAPGYPCLICRNRIDMARAAAEQLHPDERRKLADEGYAPELGHVEPSVVSYTSLVASWAVAELLERLTGYGPVPAPSELIVRAHEREISTNRKLPREGHFCDPSAGLLGKGLSTPFLDVAW